METIKIQKLQFDGIFQGRESKIRVTPDNMISVFDFIKVAGGQEQPRKTWSDIEKKYKNEVVTESNYFKFDGQGQKLTPVISVNGMVKLLFWLPGEIAKQFRSKSAEIMIRYLGGDVTLIDEIKKIDQEHINNPNNIAQIFRQEVNEVSQQNLLFNQDQINTSNKLIAYFGDKKDIFYLFSFIYLEKLYAKFGIVGEIREFHKRVQEHIKEFESICFHNILQCSNITKVEADFKETALYTMNKVKIPKKNGGNNIEVIKLSKIITTSVIKEEMIKIAGERMIDPPPIYQPVENYNSIGNLNIEKERTKQLELQLEIKKLEFEMKKFEEVSKYTNKYRENNDKNLEFTNTFIKKEENGFILWSDLWKNYQDWYTELHGNSNNLKKLQTKKYFIEKIFKIEDKMVKNKGRGWVNFNIVNS